MFSLIQRPKTIAAFAGEPLKGKGKTYFLEKKIYVFGIRRQIIEDWKIYIVPKACVLSTLHHTPLCFTACRLINTGTIPAKRSKSSPFRLIHNSTLNTGNAIKPANLIAKSLFVQKKTLDIKEYGYRF